MCSLMTIPCENRCLLLRGSRSSVSRRKWNWLQPLTIGWASLRINAATWIAIAPPVDHGQALGNHDRWSLRDCENTWHVGWRAAAQ
jgi:hypothetical protein